MVIDNDKKITESNIQKPNENISDQQNLSVDNLPNSIDTNSDELNSNCLALTVKKDYNTSIIKNSIFTTFRVSLKISLSTFILNILKMFL